MNYSFPDRLSFVLLVLGACLALTPWVSSALALVGGAAIGLLFGNPAQQTTHRWTHRLLPLAVMGLGAEMNLGTVARVGYHGLGYTAVSLTLVLAMGLLLAWFLKVDREAGLLISVGTAICGGSAIAAAAPVLRARPHQVSVALATVFLLNAAALVLFPPIGHWAGLGQNAFGLWAALAIHDTSSVVGAGMAYGPKALAVATTVKLARALWIVPLTLGLGWLVATRRLVTAESGAGEARPVKKPWFIGGFLVMAAVVTWIPALHPAGLLVAAGAHRLLVLSLFLIGAGLTREALRNVGARPFIQGLLLWLAVGGLGLAAVRTGWLVVN
ncbi:MAG: putative sulfate exporter family transporter [Holophaga sp.]|jgi:uncharacterized integral membrane protein (TIGR00698 family)